MGGPYNKSNACPGMCHTGSNSKTSYKDISREIRSNDNTVIILTPREIRALWIQEMKNRGRLSNKEADSLWEEWKFLPEFLAENAGNIDTGKSIAKLLKDLGSWGAQAYVKQYGGKSYIILKGYSGLRTILNASRYGIKNPKVLQMGLGKLGAIKSAKGGGILTVVAVAAIRIIDFFLNDKATLYQLIGTLATDVVKIAAATGASMLAATWVAGAAATATFALGPLVAVLFVGFFTAAALDWLDNKYHITEMVIEGLKQVSEFTSEQLRRLQSSVIDLGKKAKSNVINKVNQASSAAIETAADYVADQVERYIVKRANDIFWSVPKVFLK